MRPISSIAVALAAVALAVPAAQAATPQDMHASTAIAAAAAHQKQDLRSPDARDAAVQQKQDLRSPDARDAAVLHGSRSDLRVDAPGATAVDSASVASPAAPAPASTPKAADDGVDWTTIGIGVAACMVALGGIGLVLSRRPQRLRTAA